jgi:hypothetical protein
MLADSRREEYHDLGRNIVPQPSPHSPFADNKEQSLHGFFGTPTNNFVERTTDDIVVVTVLFHRVWPSYAAPELGNRQV